MEFFCDCFLFFSLRSQQYLQVRGKNILVIALLQALLRGPELLLISFHRCPYPFLHSSTRSWYQPHLWFRQPLSLMQLNCLCFQKAWTFGLFFPHLTPGYSNNLLAIPEWTHPKIHLYFLTGHSPSSHMVWPRWNRR